MSCATETSRNGFLFSNLPRIHQPLRRRDTVVSRETVLVHRRTDRTGLGDEEIVAFDRTIVRVRRAVAVAVIRLTRGSATCEIDRQFEYADEDGFLSCLAHMRGSCADLLYGFEPYWPSSEYHVDVDLRVEDVPFDLKTADATREPVVHAVPDDWRVRCGEGHLHPILGRRLFSGTIWSSRLWHGRGSDTMERDPLLAGLDARQKEAAGIRIDGFESSIVGMAARISVV